MTQLVPTLTEEQLKRLASAAEARVYRACRDALTGRVTIIFSLPWVRVSAHGTPRDGETDFIVFDETRGILIIEVKGGGVRVDVATGSWWSLDRHGNKNLIKDPFRQATTQKYALQEYLNESPRWSAVGQRPTIGHAVLFPDLDDASSLVSTDRRREIVGTRTDIDTLPKWLASVFDFWAKGSSVGLGSAGMKVVDDLFCKAREVRPLLCHELDGEERERVRLTEEQTRVLRVLGRRNRVVVSGGAGTGKTLLAVEKARELSGAGLNTLLICYNRPLADHLRTCLEVRSTLHVMNFHQLCDQFVRAATQRSGHDLLQDAEDTNPGANRFDVHYPHALAMATETLTERFDAIVVDEAQDFGEEYWFPIELLLRDQNASTLFIFFDHNQSVYRRVSSFPIQDDPFLLTRNCRNTRYIHNAAYAYYTGVETEPPPLEGVAIEIIEAPSRGSQVKRLHNHLVALLDTEKVTPDSVAILVPSRDHRAYYDLLRERPLPRPARWAFEEYSVGRGVRVDTAQRFKGLEAAVVYLWGVGEFELDRDRELLYVTLSRAKSRLYLIGELSPCQAILRRSHAASDSVAARPLPPQT